MPFIISPNTTPRLEHGGGRGCPVCAAPLRDGEGCSNWWCGRPDRGFSVVFAVGAHQRELRHAIASYKYRGELWWAKVFAAMIAHYLTDHATWFEEVDFLIPMPAYCGPGAQRTWDPLGLIAAQMVDQLGPSWCIVPDLVDKVARTPPMAGRSWTSRQAIAAGPLRRALRVTRPDIVDGSRILVLDDVMTEGSTLREVARCLVAAGAAEVAGLVISRPGRTTRRTARWDGRLSS